MEQTIKRIKENRKKFFVTILSSLFLFSNTAFAANLSFSPSSGTYSKNTTFSVGVYVSSTDQAMNAASATIQFPTDKLQVVSVSKTGSIIDFWAQEPSFSNATGQIKMEGVVLTPGYKGGSGKLITINFKGKSASTASINISSSSVLANDGVGTNILKNVSGATFNIKEEAPVKTEVIDLETIKPIEEDTVAEEVCEPDSLITSATHPGVIWRRDNTAVFSWDVSDEIVASKIAFDKNPNTEPNIINSPAIVEKRYENVEDGVWYFHLSLQDNDGWSTAEHFKIKIDHTPPEINVSEIKRSELTDPKPVINLKITDKVSCVKDFTLSINGESLDYERLDDGNIRLETVEPGDHELVITAYDRAGNKNEAFIPIIVEAIEAPRVTDHPAEINVGESLQIKGESIPNGNIEAKITSKQNNFLIKETLQTGSGRFTFEQEDLRAGTYFVSFRVTDKRGAMSSWSVPIQIRVRGDGFLGMGNIINNLGVEVSIGIGVILVLALILITRGLTIRAIRRRYE